MLNQVVLVGRLAGETEIIEAETAKKIYKILLAVPRSFKNESGEYETDFISCTLYGNIGEQTNSWCEKGDLVGIKGRIKGQDGKINIVAEKVTFLSSKKEGEKE